MGCTIHYEIVPPDRWDEETRIDQLREVWVFAASLPFQTVGPIYSPRSMEERNDLDHPYAWTLLRLPRNVYHPARPGQTFEVLPTRTQFFVVQPAEGCEPFDVGVNQWDPIFVPPAMCPWIATLARKGEHPRYRNLLRKFQRRWHLRRCPLTSRPVRTEEFLERWYETPAVRAGTIRRNGVVGCVQIAVKDGYLKFVRSGDLLQIASDFQSPEFARDVEMIAGRTAVRLPACRGWQSFCKTCYANDPRYGGLANFLRAHVGICAVLWYASRLGFRVTVDDEGEFWGIWRLQRLVEVIGKDDSTYLWQPSRARRDLQRLVEGAGTITPRKMLGFLRHVTEIAGQCAAEVTS